MAWLLTAIRKDPSLMSGRCSMCLTVLLNVTLLALMWFGKCEVMWWAL